jgi:integrase
VSPSLTSKVELVTRRHGRPPPFPRVRIRAGVGGSRGFEGVRPEWLRHTGAGLAYAATPDLSGHAIVAVTLRTYFHPDKDAAAEAITRADRLLGWTGS